MLPRVFASAGLLSFAIFFKGVFKAIDRLMLSFTSLHIWIMLVVIMKNHNLIIKWNSFVWFINHWSFIQYFIIRSASELLASTYPLLSGKGRPSLKITSNVNENSFVSYPCIPCTKIPLISYQLRIYDDCNKTKITSHSVATPFKFILCLVSKNFNFYCCQ